MRRTFAKCVDENVKYRRHGDAKRCLRHHSVTKTVGLLSLRSSTKTSIQRMPRSTSRDGPPSRTGCGRTRHLAKASARASPLVKGLVAALAVCDAVRTFDKNGTTTFSTKPSQLRIGARRCVAVILLQVRPESHADTFDLCETQGHARRSVKSRKQV